EGRNSINSNIGSINSSSSSIPNSGHLFLTSSTPGSPVTSSKTVGPTLRHSSSSGAIMHNSSQGKLIGSSSLPSPPGSGKFNLSPTAESPPMSLSASPDCSERKLKHSSHARKSTSPAKF